MLIGVLYNYDLPFIWNETGLHSGNKSLCYSNVSAKEQLHKQTAWVHKTLCEGIILQKRFVRELYCRNYLWRRVIEYFGIEKKMHNINFLSNIFQSGVINVALCSLLIKTKQLSFIYHKNCITAFLVIHYNFSNAQQEPNSSGHLTLLRGGI
jgi:hypothetical protein